MDWLAHLEQIIIAGASVAAVLLIIRSGERGKERWRADVDNRMKNAEERLDRLSKKDDRAEEKTNDICKSIHNIEKGMIRIESFFQGYLSKIGAEVSNVGIPTEEK